MADDSASGQTGCWRGWPGRTGPKPIPGRLHRLHIPETGAQPHWLRLRRTEKIILKCSQDSTSLNHKSDEPDWAHRYLLVLQVANNITPNYYARLLFRRHEKLVDTLDHCRRIELGADDFIRTIAGDTHAIVAQERHHLIRILVFYFAA